VCSWCSGGGGGGGGGGVMAMVGSGGGDSVRTVPLIDGGAGGGHTSDPVSGETRLASLAPVCGSRVSMGRPLGPIWIRAVCLYFGLGGDSGTGITLTGSSSSSSMTTATSSTPSTVVTPSSPSSPPSLGLSDDNTDRLSATG
jgi:hypothetical protein